MIVKTIIEERIGNGVFQVEFIDDPDESIIIKTNMVAFKVDDNGLEQIKRIIEKAILMREATRMEGVL